MEALKPLIRALANSNAGGMTVAQLDRDFQSTEGTKIPFWECGFPSLEAMLRSMGDTVRVTSTNAIAVIYPILTAETQHIRNMVLKSKKNKRKRPTPHAHKPNNNAGTSSGYTARYTLIEIKSIIRALAVSKAYRSITVAQLQTDFEAMEGANIPYQSLGFATLSDFLRSMPDVVRVSGDGLTATVQPVTNKHTAHIRQMVNGGKKNTYAKQQKKRKTQHCPRGGEDYHFNNFSQYSGRQNRYTQTNGNGNATDSNWYTMGSNYGASNQRNAFGNDFTPSYDCYNSYCWQNDAGGYAVGSATHFNGQNSVSFSYAFNQNGGIYMHSSIEQYFP